MPSSEPRVSVIIPVIRREKFKRCLAAVEAGTYRSFEIVFDFDDARIGAPKMVNRLVARSHFDLVCFVGDDTIPAPDMIQCAVDAMGRFPDGWGLVGINDNIRRAHQVNKSAHFLLHKRLLSHVGGVMFHEGYKHCYCDNELIDRAVEIGRYVLCKESRLFHDHPAGDKRADDPDYQRVYGAQSYIHDLQLYRRRRRAGWNQ